MTVNPLRCDGYRLGTFGVCLNLKLTSIMVNAAPVTRSVVTVIGDVRMIGSLSFTSVTVNFMVVKAAYKTVSNRVSNSIILIVGTLTISYIISLFYRNFRLIVTLLYYFKYR